MVDFSAVADNVYELFGLDWHRTHVELFIRNLFTNCCLFIRRLFVSNQNSFFFLNYDLIFHSVIVLFFLTKEDHFHELDGFDGVKCLYRFSPLFHDNRPLEIFHRITDKKEYKDKKRTEFF